MRSSLLSAPLTLKARIGWTPSILMETWQPALAVKAREYWSGVGGRWGRRSAAACSTAPAVTECGSLLGRVVVSRKGFIVRRALPWLYERLGRASGARAGARTKPRPQDPGPQGHRGQPRAQEAGRRPRREATSAGPARPAGAGAAAPASAPRTRPGFSIGAGTAPLLGCA